MVHLPWLFLDFVLRKSELLKILGIKSETARSLVEIQLTDSGKCKMHILYAERI